MSLIRRTYLGVDLRADELKAVAMQRHGRDRMITAARLLQLPNGLVRVSSREPNIKDVDKFCQRLRDVVGPLSRSEERVAVSIPDGCGRQLLTEVEAPFSSHQEGIDILRWQLKTHLPGTPQDVHLDYQLLDQQENGRYRVLVALVKRSVIEQIEQAFDLAGFQAVLLDFHCTHLYNWYRFVADIGENTVLISVEGGTFSIRYLIDDRTVFVRCRDLEADARQMFLEMNRSLAGARENHPEIIRARVSLHTDWDPPEDLVEAAASIFETDVQMLDPRFDRHASGTIDLPAARRSGFVAAAGAAERMIR